MGYQVRWGVVPFLPILRATQQEVAVVAEVGRGNGVAVCKICLGRQMPAARVGPLLSDVFMRSSTHTTHSVPHIIIKNTELW